MSAALFFQIFLFGIATVSARYCTEREYRDEPSRLRCSELLYEIEPPEGGKRAMSEQVKNCSMENGYNFPDLTKRTRRTRDTYFIPDVVKNCMETSLLKILNLIDDSGIIDKNETVLFFSKVISGNNVAKQMDITESQETAIQERMSECITCANDQELKGLSFHTCTINECIGILMETNEQLETVQYKQRSPLSKKKRD
ncbi:uncharacterized protein [Palaemon carinicauda]|uniref:uncharacterized protein n=1 Tax=Palaemon carinicauda TaxID=392227 RepID=UPI0035B61A6C